MSKAKLKFYTYKYRDPRDGTPRYVGEGQGNRAYEHLNDADNARLAAFIAELRALGLEPIVDIVAYFATKAEAVAREKELIAHHGRLIYGEGPLFNILPGPAVDFEAILRRDADPAYQALQIEIENRRREKREKQIEQRSLRHKENIRRLKTNHLKTNHLKTKKGPTAHRLRYLTDFEYRRQIDIEIVQETSRHLKRDHVESLTHRWASDPDLRQRHAASMARFRERKRQEKLEQAGA